MQTVEAFCRAWTSAELHADADTLEQLLADDFVGVGPLGFTLPKQAWLDRHRSGDMRYETYGLDEVDTRARDGSVAVVTARQRARGSYRGQPTPEELRATVVLVPARDRWQLLGVHLSLIAGTPGAPPPPVAPGDRT
jgi:ketosteroid isomerase-like protein